MTFLVPLAVVLAIVYAIRQVRTSATTSPVTINDQRAILAKYATQYQRLSETEKRVFEAKVALFLNEKNWVGAGIGLVPEMKVMIAACAAQL